MMNTLRKWIDTGRERPSGEAGPSPKPPRPSGRGRKRGFSRHPVQVRAVVRAGERVVAGISHSLGMGGLLMTCRGAFPPETDVTVELCPPYPGVPALETRGAVAYLVQDGMGIRFTELSQADCRYLRDLFLHARRG
jgi:hypothetical protein